MHSAVSVNKEPEENQGFPTRLTNVTFEFEGRKRAEKVIRSWKLDPLSAVISRGAVLDRALISSRSALFVRHNHLGITSSQAW